MKKRKWIHEERMQWLKDNNKVFYCNKTDTALWVRKQHALNWTLNWGNPWSYVLVSVIVIIIVVGLIIS